jgi:membrane protease YdiL (CAAX protease family)
VLLPSVAATLLAAGVIPAAALERVQDGTRGLVTPTLVLSGAVLLLLAAGFRFAGIRASDVGLHRASRLPALGVGVGLWLAGTLAAWGAAIALTGAAPGLHPSWAARGPLVMASILFGAVLAAAVEEVVFRGLLLSQLRLRLEVRTARPRAALAAAVLLSQAVFAVAHAPARIGRGDYDSPGAVLADQAGLLLAGLIGAWIVLATGGILVAIGVHALANAPTALFAAPADAPALSSRGFMLLILLTGLALRSWHLRTRRAAGQSSPERPPRAGALAVHGSAASFQSSLGAPSRPAGHGPFEHLRTP